MIYFRPANFNTFTTLYMLLFKRINDLQSYLQSEKEKDQTVGFVPTMGALHKGHLSLFEKCLEVSDISVGSIFVNPTQFNEASDLQKYPRTPERDIDLLTGIGCDVLFMPSVEEVYPNSYKTKGQQFDFGHLDQSMEGAHRPGHFQGMAQVVNRLLDIVKPDSLFMGQKDFQQFTIVKEMLRQMNSSTQLTMCPIIREGDGLAMSSRNRRLSKEQRLVAPNIFRTLNVAKEKTHSHSPEQIEKEALMMLAIPGMEPEYFEIVDGTTLQPFEQFEEVEMAVACTAVRLGTIRLIDNMILKGAG